MRIKDTTVSTDRSLVSLKYEYICLAANFHSQAEAWNINSQTPLNFMSQV